MNGQVPRLRMFAGPNGSGKSSIQSVIGRELLGVYINPDDIEKSMDKRVLEMKTGQMPQWFKHALWDKFSAKQLKADS